MQYIYLIACLNYKKIGIAGDVGSRLAALQTGNPFPLSLHACYAFDNAEIVERVIHQKFCQLRERGEWFSLSDENVTDFHAICNLLGGVRIFDGEIAVLTQEAISDAEEAEETQDILLGGISWRLETRNDRNPPGYAIFRRGADKKYLGYIGMKNLKDPQHPTVEEIISVLEKNGYEDK